MMTIRLDMDIDQKKKKNFMNLNGKEIVKDVNNIKNKKKDV